MVHDIRFRALFTLPDGWHHSELTDFGEVDDDGRIATLFTFEEPLAEGAAPPNTALPAAQAAMRYIALRTECDPAARRARFRATAVPPQLGARHWQAHRGYEFS